MRDAPPVRTVDFDAISARSADERFTQELIGAASGSESCMVSYIVTPPGGGSPAGLHVHEVDQLFFILSGTMQIEIAGTTETAPAGSLVVFPKGVPHRNWNAGPRETVHLAINTPTPDPDLPFARSL
jgi:quercetin dioxygenase-like cupin family protein